MFQLYNAGIYQNTIIYFSTGIQHATKITYYLHDEQEPAIFTDRVTPFHITISGKPLWAGGEK